MDAPLHLLFPLLSSLLFVVAASFAKRATSLGASPYTVTAYANLSLAICWAIVGVVRQESLPPEAWWPATWIALSFVAGQLFTFLAFQLGDVSLATPVFGVKIIMVAMICSLLDDTAIGLPIWIAAVLAAIGIGVIQGGRGRSAAAKLSAKKTGLTIGLAVLAALSLSIFDVGLQFHGRQHGAVRFLTTMFILAGVFSCGLFAWSDRPSRLRELGADGPLLWAVVLMTVQAISICYALGQFGDATRINIVYSLRGLWSVVIAWLLARFAAGFTDSHSPRTLAFRLAGAVLLTVAVIIALR